RNRSLTIRPWNLNGQTADRVQARSPASRAIRLIFFKPKSEPLEPTRERNGGPNSGFRQMEAWKHVLAVVVFFGMVGATVPANAVPSYSRQNGDPCSSWQLTRVGAP